MRRRPRTTSVLVVLGGGIVLLVAATQTWFDVTLATGDPLEVGGAAAVPVLAPLGLAAIALGLALTVVGRIVRYALGAIAALIGVGVGVLAVRTALAPLDAVAGSVTTATGIEGSGIGDLVTTIAASAWPWVAVAASVIVVIGGLLVLVTGARWGRTGRRFDGEAAGDTAPARPRDTVDSWDDLSHGADPTA